MIHINPMTLGDEDFLHRARSTCRHKAAYVTRAEIRTFLRRNSLSGSIYKCQICGYYHHTTYARPESKAFSKRLRSLLA